MTGSSLHRRFRRRSSSLDVDSAARPAQNGWGPEGLGGAEDGGGKPARLFHIPLPGFGGISRYVGKKYVYFRLSHDLKEGVIIRVFLGGTAEQRQTEAESVQVYNSEGDTMLLLC